MAVPDGRGEEGMHPGNSPERERGRRMKQRHGSETEKLGDGVAAGGVETLLALQRLRGPHLLSVYLMTLMNKKHKT